MGAPTAGHAWVNTSLGIYIYMDGYVLSVSSLESTYCKKFLLSVTSYIRRVFYSTFPAILPPILPFLALPLISKFKQHYKAPYASGHLKSNSSPSYFMPNPIMTCHLIGNVSLCPMFVSFSCVVV